MEKSVSAEPFEQKWSAEVIPIELQRRLQALQKLQIQTFKIDVEFHKAVYELDREYQRKHEKTFRLRQAIINGDHEPTDDECSLAECMNLLQGFELKSSADHNAQCTDSLLGIPNFWLTILKSDTILGKLVNENDEPALSFLSDIRVESRPPPNYSFVIEFNFRPNAYFTNTVLAKEYLLQCDVTADDPFAFDGPEIYRAIGCTIDWKDGMDLMERAGDTASVPTMDMYERYAKESFFYFFSPPDSVPEIDSSAEIINSMTSLDFEIGLYIKEKIIPSAVLYFLDEKSSTLSEDELLEFSDDDDDEVHKIENWRYKSIQYFWNCY